MRIPAAFRLEDDTANFPAKRIYLEIKNIRNLPLTFFFSKSGSLVHLLEVHDHPVAFPD